MQVQEAKMVAGHHYVGETLRWGFDDVVVPLVLPSAKTPHIDQPKFSMFVD